MALEFMATAILNVPFEGRTLRLNLLKGYLKEVLKRFLMNICVRINTYT